LCSFGAWTFRTTIWHQRPISAMYDILSLTNSILWTAHYSDSLSIEKCVFSCSLGTTAPPSIWTPAPPLNSTYILIVLLTLYEYSEPALYKLLTFHVTSLMSIFHRLDRLSKESVQVWSSCLCFVTGLFFMVRGC
jgi:hypothetical protein